jgi:hypothetical protein
LTSESYPVAPKGVIGRRRQKGADDGKDVDVVEPRGHGWVEPPAGIAREPERALGGLAAKLKVLALPSGDVPKLVGGVALLVAMWRWTTPRSARGRRSHLRRF